MPCALRLRVDGVAEASFSSGWEKVASLLLCLNLESRKELGRYQSILKVL